MLLTSSTEMGSNAESTVGIMTTAAESYVSFLSLIVICATLLILFFTNAVQRFLLVIRWISAKLPKSTVFILLLSRSEDIWSSRPL